MHTRHRTNGVVIVSGSSKSSKKAVTMPCVFLPSNTTGTIYTAKSLLSIAVRIISLSPLTTRENGAMYDSCIGYRPEEYDAISSKTAGLCMCAILLFMNASIANLRKDYVVKQLPPRLVQSHGDVARESITRSTVQIISQESRYAQPRDPSPSRTVRKLSRPASRFSMISAARSSGSGRSSRSVRLLSLSQKMSRLVLSRVMISS